ncbi:hypothetical protein ACX0G9_12215 [Flavitalea flava]
MNKILILFLTIFISTVSFCQKIETVYLDKNDSTANMYIAVVLQNGQINSFMFLLDGFGNYSPQNLLIETDLPKYVFSNPSKVNEEVTYMIGRIKKEMAGTPETALENFYNNSPYSFSDTTQIAIKPLIKTPIMIISEPDIQWWLSQRGYDYSYINITDQAAMINELQKLGNDKAVLITTINKGYRKPNNNRHPHSWSIADTEQTFKWLKSQK